jgi:hypothetical protein
MVDGVPSYRFGPDEEAALRQLGEDVAALSSAFNGVSFEKIMHDLHCLKFELKRHIAHHPEASEADGKSPRSRLTGQGAAVAEAGDLAAIREEIDELRRAIGGVQQQRAPQVSQVFVDLPPGPACRVVFRGRQRRTGT